MSNMRTPNDVIRLAVVLQGGVCVVWDEGVAFVIAVLKTSGVCCWLAWTAAARLGCPPWRHWFFVEGLVKFPKSSAVLLLEVKMWEELPFNTTCYIFSFPCSDNECRLMNFNIYLFLFLKKKIWYCNPAVFGITIFRLKGFQTIFLVWIIGDSWKFFILWGFVIYFFF